MSLNAGLVAAERAGIPVGTWGGGFGHAVVAVNGSGGPMAIPVTEQMVGDMGGTGSVLAPTYHTGQVCREREEEMDRILTNYPNITVTKNEARIPGYLQDGAQCAAAWLASHPAGGEPLAIWGCWDDPALGALSTMRQQSRDDVLVYGVNGNAEAILAVQNGWMTATAWQQSVDRIKVLAFVVAAMAAGLTGILLASLFGSGTTTAADAYLLNSFAAVFLGSATLRDGEFHVPGAFIGVLIIGIGFNGLAIFGAPTFYQYVFQGGILIAAVGLSTVARRYTTR